MTPATYLMFRAAWMSNILVGATLCGWHKLPPSPLDWNRVKPLICQKMVTRPLTIRRSWCIPFSNFFENFIKRCFNFTHRRSLFYKKYRFSIKLIIFFTYTSNPKSSFTTHFWFLWHNFSCRKTSGKYLWEDKKLRQGW